MYVRSAFLLVQRSLHALSVIVLTILAVASVAYTIASAVGLAPWLTLEAQFGTAAPVDAGMIVQLAITGIFASLLFFVPANARILQLERSHRRFSLTMDDVARAYHICHHADRAGVFTMSSEFDAVRERIAYMRDHPDLAGLEADVLDVAAQMSQSSRHLADVYSDEKVARARTFLAQRQEEAERQQDLILQAQHACRDLQHWREQVEMEESVVASQLARLEDELETVLPPLGYELAAASSETGTNVVPLASKPAAE